MTQVKNVSDILNTLSSKSWMFYVVALLCFLLQFLIVRGIIHQEPKSEEL